jgi:type I restriction enzyme R subunit
MSLVQTEKDYQKFIVDYLESNNGFIVHADNYFNTTFAFDNDLLASFLYATQKKTMQALEKIYKSDTIPRVLASINAEITKKGSSLILFWSSDFVTA